MTTTAPDVKVRVVAPDAEEPLRQVQWRIRFPAPTVAWSTNEGGHWAKHQAKKRAWADTVQWVARRGKVPALPGRWMVKMTIPFSNNRRRDPSNYVGTVLKVAVDSLVREGIWPDDNPLYVVTVEPELYVAGPDMLVTIELTPV